MSGAFERDRRVRFGHCDPAGIVFYPQYLVMCNELVEDWFDTALGIPYAQFIGQRRLGLPTARLECDFTAISRFGDVLTQRLGVQRAGRTSLDVGIEMHGADGLRLRARQVLVCTSLQTHRPMPLPDDLRLALEPYLVRMTPDQVTAVPKPG
jgi:4-hydroxybenzoyl-CoA thioesterase